MAQTVETLLRENVFGEHDARKRQAKIAPAFTFTERGEAQTGNEVGMMPWAFGPPGAEPIITGIDVLVTKGDKIGAVYVFQGPPKK